MPMSLLGPDSIIFWSCLGTSEAPTGVSRLPGLCGLLAASAARAGRPARAGPEIGSTRARRAELSEIPKKCQAMYGNKAEVRARAQGIPSGFLGFLFGNGVGTELRSGLGFGDFGVVGSRAQLAGSFPSVDFYMKDFARISLKPRVVLAHAEWGTLQSIICRAMQDLCVCKHTYMGRAFSVVGVSYMDAASLGFQVCRWANLGWQDRLCQSFNG